MPRKRAQPSGYERIAEHDGEEEEDGYTDEEQDYTLRDPLSTPVASKDYAPIQPRRKEPMRMPSSTNSTPRRPRRTRANSGVDIKAINQRLERWAEEIKQRFKRRGIKGKSAEEERLEIHHSVFQAPEWVKPATKQDLENDRDGTEQRLSGIEFDDIVESVRTAIELGLHPKLISQGSSGSYFARNSGGKVVGVFKPKDEEPYASKNPKWTKWIHRNLFPFAFGRVCLIPNLSYVSEAAAYILDVQLRTNIVPYTDVVSLSSKSFFYDYWDRRAFYRKRKPLPEKQGSFQVFLKGYKGATEFFREHPWPDPQTASRSREPSQSRKKKLRWTDDCRPSSAPGAKEEDEEDEDSGPARDASSSPRNEFWSEELQQSFREKLERLVILDYIMRNTDRGTDNWMLRIDREKNEASLVVKPADREARSNGAEDEYQRRNESMVASTPPNEEEVAIARLGAIDNSLSWPWKHPDAWRSYPFGWLFLPVSLIGQPFTEKTKQHFLPLLTSKDWWTETQVKLRATFEIDVDFKEKMFARQMAVMKGQAWNVVETLKTPDHGPLELARRARVCVWDDLVDIPVAVPLQRPSEEMRRMTTAQTTRVTRRGIVEEAEEEMDISAARSPPPTAPLPPATDNSSTPTKSRPTNLFNYARQNSSQDIPQTSSSPSAAAEELAAVAAALRPSTTRARTGGVRVSYDGGSRGFSYARSPTAERRRRFSFSVGRRTSGFASDDDDGDLGYAAANDLQNATRKVIVERLEMVKTKPPVFTCC